MNKIKNLFISLCSMSLGSYFLFLCIKMLLALGPSLFQRDSNPLYSYRWSDVFSEFILSVIVGVGLIANGLWFMYLFFNKKLKDDD